MPDQSTCTESMETYESGQYSVMNPCGIGNVSYTISSVHDMNQVLYFIQEIR